jgi:hypothetical protein
MIHTKNDISPGYVSREFDKYIGKFQINSHDVSFNYEKHQAKKNYKLFMPFVHNTDAFLLASSFLIPLCSMMSKSDAFHLEEYDNSPVSIPFGNKIDLHQYSILQKHSSEEKSPIISKKERKSSLILAEM